jgi:hypothetical protein
MGPVRSEIAVETAALTGLITVACNKRRTPVITRLDPYIYPQKGTIYLVWDVEIYFTSLSIDLARIGLGPARTNNVGLTSGDRTFL